MTETGTTRGTAQAHGMADWLNLHGLDTALCQKILDAATAHAEGQTFNRPAIGAVPHPMTAEAAWRYVARAFGTAYPWSAETIDRMMKTTVTQFNPDPQKYPRPFTLHDDGQGHAYVSCLYRGSAGDFMALAHEFGHAVQITASGGQFRPPMIRETCAFLAELTVLNLLQQDLPNLYPNALLVWRGENRVLFGKSRRDLNKALADAGAVYTYRWNYPIARLLAVLSHRQLPPDDLWRLAQGEATVAGLCDLLGLQAIPAQ